MVASVVDGGPALCRRIMFNGSLIVTRDIEPMMFYCWPTVTDGGPTL